MKVSGDVKPKLEPESPIVQQPAPIMKPTRAAKAKAGGIQPKLEPPLEEGVESIAGVGSRQTRAESITEMPIEQDVKPDVQGLEDLLGGLNLE